MAYDAADRNFGFEITGPLGYRSGGAALSLDADEQVQIVDDAPSPADDVERLLDLPQGETVGSEGMEVLRRFYEVLESGIRHYNSRDALGVVRRVLAIGHRVGALRGFLSKRSQRLLEALRSSQ